MENSLEDIVASFLHMMYLWTVAFLSPLSISYSDFLVRFSLHSYAFPCVYFQCT
jgi:hypothetical protein